VLSPDGQWLAVPLADGATTNIWLQPTAGGAMKPITDFGDRSIEIARTFSWSADGHSIYAAIGELEADVVLIDGLIP
jgi:Tol biopolymer transport system component